MKNLVMTTAVMFFCTGCMFVSESYAPAENGEGYEVKGSCVGYQWDRCQARAEALCAEVGKVGSVSQSGGPQNAIIPKRVLIKCVE
ncbi:MAG: hypothetical protein AB1650_02750 [Candidatus Omnitrophota bacterium]